MAMSPEGVVSLSKFLTGIGIVVAGALLLRTMGRLNNPAYTQFINVLADAKVRVRINRKKIISGLRFI